MKTVEYMGSTYEVPDWASCIATDGDGMIWCYEFEPAWYDTEWIDDKGGRVKGVAYTKPTLKRI